MIATILSWKNMLAGQSKRHAEYRDKLEEQEEERQHEFDRLIELENQDSHLEFQIREAEHEGLKEFDDTTYKIQ
jgi:hypothetical protein